MNPTVFVGMPRQGSDRLSPYRGGMPRPEAPVACKSARLAVSRLDMARTPGNPGADTMKPGFGRLRRLIFDSKCLPIVGSFPKWPFRGHEKALENAIFSRASFGCWGGI